jgi:phytoene dehydrogenase-like protein
MYDAIVIGAGLSGLAAGIRLATYDQRVCVLERHTTIGGLNSFYRLGGRNYDVGLHAVTNYARPGNRSGPLGKLLRQLRLRWEEFDLSPQVGSRVAFPGVSLEFNNDPELLLSQVHEHFPQQTDRLRRLMREVVDYDELEGLTATASARQTVAQIITDPLLREMLFCPIMFYGNPREHDMEFGQFSILFRSIFLEGLARPAAGIRLILKALVRRFKAAGGELRLRSGVARIVVEANRAVRVVLENGEELAARWILSSAGWLETLRLCDDCSRVEPPRPGQLSFVESISVLHCQPRELGCDRTVVFYNDQPHFHWERPAELVDLRSGVICSPNNFLYAQPPAEGMLRITHLANYDRWAALSPSEYRLAKLRWYDRSAAAAVRFVPEFRHAVVAVDMFTPTTIRRYTGHENGAVYGAPEKRRDGRTHLENLFLCGTDQGLVGIIGAILSGITVANRYCLRP